MIKCPQQADFLIHLKYLKIAGFFYQFIYTPKTEEFSVQNLLKKTFQTTLLFSLISTAWAQDSEETPFVPNPLIQNLFYISHPKERIEIDPMSARSAFSKADVAFQKQGYDPNTMGPLLEAAAIYKSDDGLAYKSSHLRVLFILEAKQSVELQQADPVHRNTREVRVLIEAPGINKYKNMARDFEAAEEASSAEEYKVVQIREVDNSEPLNELEEQTIEDESAIVDFI